MNVNNEVIAVSLEPIAKLLRDAAPHRRSELDALLIELSPACELDCDAERVLFQAALRPPKIRIGVKCTQRLEAHAYFAAICISAFGTPGYAQMGIEERRTLFRPAGELLNWAVSRDLAQAPRAHGAMIDAGTIFQGRGEQLSPRLISSLSDQQRVLGRGYFRIALAYILLHELAHLRLSHAPCEGFWSIQQEHDADRFAAEWLGDAPDDFETTFARQVNTFIGIALAVLWLVVPTAFFGPRQSTTHPQAHDRLYAVIKHVTGDPESKEASLIWYFVATLLFCHMDAARFTFDPVRMQGSAHDEANYLLDLLSARPANRDFP